MAVPAHDNWLQLQKVFDSFRNGLRSYVFFGNKEQNSSNNFRNNNGVNNPPKKKCNWSAPKKNSLELEAFLTTLERNIFCNTKPNDVKDDLSEEKRSALKNWRNDVQFDKKSELVMRLQEKGYVIVDKEIDQRKAQQEIAKSSFQDCNYDPTKEHIEKVEQ